MGMPRLSYKCTCSLQQNLIADRFVTMEKGRILDA